MSETVKKGRKPKPAGEKRNKKILLAFTAEERELLETASGNVPLATWAHAVLLRAAKRASHERR